MRTEQMQWTPHTGWSHATSTMTDADLVLVFGASDLLLPGRLDELKERYPQARQFGCSTSGEILGTGVFDDSITATAVKFNQTSFCLARQPITSASDSESAGAALAEQLPQVGLSHVLVLSDGLQVNGTDLVRGLKGELPANVEVTGGLSGDGARFGRTLVIADTSPQERLVAAIGFYGDKLKVGYGSLGGWDTFGPERLVTRAEGNILYELDGLSALALYKEYLGDHAQGLPATGLLFPLALREPGGEYSVVRTILGVDENAGSMVFAGDIPEGFQARLMKANFDRLVDGAGGAAKASTLPLRGAQPELAILISCVGRKLVLKQRVEEEVEATREILGPSATLTGFYSYGEISPHTPGAKCELHNQTMTITTFTES